MYFTNAKRLLFVAAASIAAALLLAACGGSSSSSSSSGGGGEAGGEQFSTAEFQKTFDAVKAKTGADTELLEIQITTAGTDYKIRNGEQATGFHFDPGSSDAQDVKVEVTGAGSLANSAYPISEVDPAAIDKMVTAAPDASGVSDFKPTVMTLGKSFSADLEWTVNGEGEGRTGLVLTAKPDGSGLSSPVGKVPGGGATGAAGASGAGGATGTTAAGQDAAAIAQCIQNAGGDVNKIQACTQ